MGKIGRNAPCPCGSGKKYKKCCLSQDRAVRNKRHSRWGRRLGIRRVHNMPKPRPQQIAEAVQATGRVLGYDQQFVIDEMKKAGLRPAYIHAYQKVGHLITTSNRAVLPQDIVAEWDTAVEEYLKDHPEGEPDGAQNDPGSVSSVPHVRQDADQG